MQLTICIAYGACAQKHNAWWGDDQSVEISEHYTIYYHSFTFSPIL